MLTQELDATYSAVAARFPQNKAVRFETVAGKPELVLSPLDKLEEPPSLVALRNEVPVARMPRVDLPEILLEIAARTGCMDAFTHLTERTARATDLTPAYVRCCSLRPATLGPEPFVRQETPALRRDRLLWVDQNYVREETLMAANNLLVAAQSRIPLAQAWGGGDVASADGMRFVVPGAHDSCWTEPEVFQPRARRHLVTRRTACKNRRALLPSACWLFGCLSRTERTVSPETVGPFHDGELGSIPQRVASSCEGSSVIQKPRGSLQIRLQVKYRTLEAKRRKAA